MEVYLDHNATTPTDDRVVAAMSACLTEGFGNAASVHRRGRAAQLAVADARDSVASLLGCDPKRVIWTSGATEALNTALKGLRMPARGANVVVGSGDHKAVLDTAAYLENGGLAEIRVVRVCPDGRLDLEHLADLVDNRTALVAALAANNETGVLTDIFEVAELAHRSGALVMCDATQQVGKLPIDLESAEVDLAAASAHKLHGPQGVGVLVTPSRRRPAQLEPLIHGGGHQDGLRSGTLNLPGIVGFGKAAELAFEALADGEPERIARLRDRLEDLIEKQAGPVTVHGADAPRLPNTMNVRIYGVDSEALIVNCPGVAMSSGSACTSAVPHPSHVLTAMGLSTAEAEESVRLSLGRHTTEAEIDQAAELIGAAAQRIREVNA